jgi:hypothetical protein
LQSILEKDVLAFIKSFDADLPDDDPKNYYLEREWRKFGNFVFSPSTIQHVVVAPGFQERALRDAPNFADKISLPPVEG